MSEPSTNSGVGERAGGFRAVQNSLFRTAAKGSRRDVSQDLVRGQVLVARGEPTDALFIVLHGALAVRRTGHLEPIAELRAGELVGEIGFFANVPRTADVVAIRDTSVLVLTRAAYQKLVAEAPAIVEALLPRPWRGALPRRPCASPRFVQSPKARTVAMIDGGLEPLPSAFDRRLRDGLAVAGAEIVDPTRLRTMFPQSALDAREVSEWLNKLEHAAPLVVYYGGREASAWARKAIRQADVVVFGCRGDAPAGASHRYRSFCLRRSSISARQIRSRSFFGEVSGTATWLARLPVFLHHHVALEDQIDIDSVVRFLSGQSTMNRCGRRRKPRNRACRKSQGLS